MITIKAKDLISVAIAASIWFKNNNNVGQFNQEEKAADKLKKELHRVIWDDDAELFIDEMPF